MNARERFLKKVNIFIVVVFIFQSTAIAGEENKKYYVSNKSFAFSKTCLGPNTLFRVTETMTSNNISRREFLGRFAVATSVVTVASQTSLLETLFGNMFSFLVRKVSAAGSLAFDAFKSKNIDAFLSSGKEYADLLKKAKSAKNVTVVLGNSAQDLDSIISSIIYANYLDKVSGKKEKVLPVLQMDRSGIGSRKELALLFDLLNISKDNFIFMDDLRQIVEKGHDINVHMVDHNGLSVEEADVFNTSKVKIAGVIDHHVQEMESGDVVDADIDTVGSCVSLVLNKMFANTEKADLVNQIVLDFPLFFQIAPILVDTENFSDEYAKIDKEVFKKLFSIHGQKDSGFSLEAAYGKLNDMAKNVKGLKPEAILAKDLKSRAFSLADGSFASLGVAVVKPKKNTSIIDGNKYNIDSDNIAEFAKAKDYDVFVVANYYKKKKKKKKKKVREMVIYLGDKVTKDVAEKIKNALKDASYVDEESGKEKSLLKEKAKLSKDGKFIEVEAYRGSRKRLLPILVDIFSNNYGGSASIRRIDATGSAA